MMELTNLFLETCPADQIIKKIKMGKWTEIVHSFCTTRDNLLFVDNTYFKHFAAKETYDILFMHIINNLDNILLSHEGFIIHLNLKHFTISDMEKHLKFMQYAANVFREKYPNKLIKCLVYNAPFVFSQITKVFGLFIDKETQEKIELVERK